MTKSDNTLKNKKTTIVIYLYYFRNHFLIDYEFYASSLFIYLSTFDSI